MILNSVLIISVLTGGVLVSSLILWILLNRKIKFNQAIKLICVAKAMNKLLLTGSGYAVASSKLKIEGLPFYKSLSSFAVLELFSITPWLAMGIYFGAKLSVKIPVFLMVFLFLILAFVVYKRDALKVFLQNALSYLKEIKSNIYMIFPLVLVNVAISILYYFFLFKAFRFDCDLLSILKIVSVAFTIGYLSPAPAGLGFKECGLVFLLVQHNLSLGESVTIAIADRMLITGFYMILASFFGADIIKNVIKDKLINRKKNKQR